MEKVSKIEKILAEEPDISDGEGLNSADTSDNFALKKAIKVLNELKFEKKTLPEAERDSELSRIMWTLKSNEEMKKRRRKNTMILYRVAAAVVLFVSVGYYFFFNNQDSSNFIAVYDVDKVNTIDKTKLILPSGKDIELDKKQNVVVNNSLKTIDILDKSSMEKKSIVVNKSELKKYNTILVPKGKIHSLELSDGTKVWINSAGVLKFPSVFANNKRVVQLSGEAQFEVKKDAKRPFIVQTEGIDVRVLGTTFNVLAYMGDDEVTTTLVSGSVKLIEKKSNRDILLKPGQQAVYSKNMNKVNVRNVETDYYTIWKDGLYMFKSEKLSTVLKRIERTFDVKISLLESQYSDYPISGKIERKMSVKETLGVMCKLLPLEVKEDGEEIKLIKKTN